MKIKHIILGILTATVGLTSCYEDKGNYDYHDITDFTITFPGNTGKGDNVVYTPRLDENLSIHPEVEGADLKNLTYTWERYTQGSEKELLKKSKDLDLPVTAEEDAPIKWKIGTYNLRLTVKDTVNQIETQKLVRVTVRSQTPVGVYVLYGNQQESDLATIEDNDFTEGMDDPVLTMGYYSSKNNGKKLAGEGRSVRWYYVMNGDPFYGLVFCTNKNIVHIDPTKFTTTLTTKDFFGGKVPAGLSIKQYMGDGAGNGYLFLDNHTFYAGSEYEYGEDYFPRMGLSLQDQSENESDIQPSYLFSDAGAMDGLQYYTLGFDANNARFMVGYGDPYAECATDEYNPVFNPSDLNGYDQLVGIDYSQPSADLYYAQNQWAILKKADGSMAACRFNITGNGEEKATYDTWNVISTHIKNPDLQNLNCFQMSPLTEGLAYLSTPETVYSMNLLENGNPAPIFTAEGNERITKIKLLKSNVMLSEDSKKTFNPAFTTNQGLSLYITTWDGQQGRVYRISVNAAGSRVGATMDKWEGFGEIHDICFRLQ